nr:Protein T12A7.6 [Haemonchus contortus]
MPSTNEPISLTDLCTRAIALQLFKVNIRWRRITDVAYSLRDFLDQLRLPPRAKKGIRSSLADVLREMKRWDEKHAEMFIDEPKNRRRVMRKSEHLRTFYEHLVWKTSAIEVDDLASARHLIATECSNWPQMQFQLACMYAMTDLIEDESRFDKYRRITFKKQLSDHPVYDFWLTLLESNWEIFFDTETRVPNQKLTLCFQFAIRHGYCQLVEYIWEKIGDNTKEYIGLLQWRSMCFRARDRDTMQFLCTRLCRMNPVGVARISWTAFFDTFYNSINNEESDVLVENKFRKRFQFLLENCCPELRKRLLKMENFRIVSDAFRYNQQETFAFLLEHMDGEQLRNAREIVDRIQGRRDTMDGERLRRALLHRQATTID